MLVNQTTIFIYFFYYLNQFSIYLSSNKHSNEIRTRLLPHNISYSTFGKSDTVEEIVLGVSSVVLTFSVTVSVCLISSSVLMCVVSPTNTRTTVSSPWVSVSFCSRLCCTCPSSPSVCKIIICPSSNPSGRPAQYINHISCEMVIMSKHKCLIYPMF